VTQTATSTGGTAALISYPDVQLGPLVLLALKNLGGRVGGASAPRGQRLPGLEEVPEAKVCTGAQREGERETERETEAERQREEERGKGLEEATSNNNHVGFRVSKCCFTLFLQQSLKRKLPLCLLNAAVELN